MTSIATNRIDRRSAFDRVVRRDAVRGLWSCRSTATAGSQTTFGPMPTVHAEGVKYGRPLRMRM